MTKEDQPILVQNDPWLEPYTSEIKGRISRFKNRLESIQKDFGSLSEFALGYRYFGLNYDRVNKGWVYREWAPQAQSLALTGSFNDWNRESHTMTQNQFGIWEIFISDESQHPIRHGDHVKVSIKANGKLQDRLPAYINYVSQDEKTYDFTGVIWSPNEPFVWTDSHFQGIQLNEPHIYECHVGMALEKEGVGTYREFADLILPRIKKQGYNAIQMMAIQEHPYYGSFGYHVSNFFAPSSRFGTPDDLKYLVNKAHELGIAIIMDLVHSHAVKNIAEGLAFLDGSEDLYFHAGGKGYHTGWDSYLFNYGKTEVLRFLLSNVRYWLEEFHFDGFRYDGVTSMLYFHHGDHVTFDNYGKYFDEVDWDVLTYLQLANTLCKEIKPGSVTIAEDMSGMPGLCRPVVEGGIGFDYRLGMGLPDYWIKILKHKKDEEWNMHEIWHTLSNRRFGEKTVAYAESHDQALVGDKTLAFWLMDKEMYEHMHVDHASIVIDRGISLHNMIRLLTLASGGEGWLNFIGNEFGHPEWVDFPREGNGWSYKYARRQWSLVDSSLLRYRQMNEFGEQIVKLSLQNHILSSLPAQPLNIDQDNHTLIFERKNLIFAFNFSPYNSIPDYRFRVPKKGKYQILLNSDRKEYGGFDRIDDGMTYPSVTLFGEHFVSIYLPNRVALVLSCIE